MVRGPVPLNRFTYLHPYFFLLSASAIVDVPLSRPASLWIQIRLSRTRYIGYMSTTAFVTGIDQRVLEQRCCIVSGVTISLAATLSGTQSQISQVGKASVEKPQGPQFDPLGD